MVPVYCAKCGIEVVNPMKGENKKCNKPLGLFQVTTTPLTTENLVEFFKPKNQKAKIDRGLE